MRVIFKNMFLIMGAIYMYGMSGCSDSIRYEKYTCDDPDFSISVDYVLGWRHSKQIGSYGSFTQTVFYKPEMKDRTLKPMMVVTAEKANKVKFKPSDLEGMENDILKKRAFFKDMKVVSRSQSRISGAKARELVLTYRSIDKFNSVDAKLIPKKERIFIVMIDNTFYTMRYENSEQDFNAFNKEFSHFVKSFKIK